MTITSGIVSIEDGVKGKEEYAPPRKVRVELHYDIEPGDDATKALDSVAAQANAKVNELLGRKVAVATGPSAPRTPEVQAADAKLAAEQPAAGAKKGPGRPPKQKTEEPKALTDKEKLAKEAGVLEEDILTGADPVVTEKDKEQPLADELEEDLLSAPAPEITDQALTDAITARNGALKKEGATTSAVKIRTLIGSYNPNPERAGFTASEIKQEHRAEFLEKLKALTKD